MVQQMVQMCEVCNGSSTVIEDKDQCESCHGKKVQEEKKKIDVDVPPGVHNNTQIMFSQQGHEVNTMKGDVVVIVQEKPHEKFKRINSIDLLLEEEIFFN